MGKIWRILSIDGGGTRGVIPATILAAIEKRTGKPISQLFDLVAGTSTGGILALGLTKPNANGQAEFSAQRLCELYERDIPKIFERPQTWWGNLLRPKYKSFSFQRVLKESIGDARLKAALTDVLIPCYDIEHRSPFMFKSRLARQKPENDFLMRDVALAASASPTLFHPVRFSKDVESSRVICLVDGGVFANNPTMCAFAEMKTLHPNESEKFLIVSIGTGKSRLPLIDEMVSLWGYVHWSRPMLELVLESGSASVHDQMTHLLASTDSKYWRLQVELPQLSTHEIDNASKANLHELSRAAQEFCKDSTSGKELDTLCDTLLRLCEAETGSPSLA